MILTQNLEGLVRDLLIVGFLFMSFMRHGRSPDVARKRKSYWEWWMEH
jgi:hypothetical protein